MPQQGLQGLSQKLPALLPVITAGLVAGIANVSSGLAFPAIIGVVAT
jgi:hypothetical protein